MSHDYTMGIKSIASSFLLPESVPVRLETFGDNVAETLEAASMTELSAQLAALNRCVHNRSEAEEEMESLYQSQIRLISQEMGVEEMVDCLRL